MDVKQINANEFLEYNTAPEFGIRSSYWPLYCFYEQHDQQALYKVLVTEGASVGDYIRVDYASVYQRFGIDFAIQHSATHKRNYVHYLDLSELGNLESFKESFEQHYFDYDKEDIGLVFIRYDVPISAFNSEQRSQISECLHQLMPSAAIANDDFIQIKTQVVSGSSEYKRVCTLDEIVSWSELTTGIQQFSKIDAILTPMLRTLEKVREVKGVDCIDASNSKLSEILTNGTRRSLAYVSLMKYGKAIYFSKDIEKLVHSYSAETQKQNAMYADDYIRYLTNLPDIAVVMGSEPFLVLPDRNKLLVHGVDLQLIYHEIDMNTFDMISDTKHVRVNSDDISIVSAAEMFNLSSTDPDVALDGMHHLYDVMLRFIKGSKDYSEFKAAILNVSNTLFFTLNGKFCMGYISYIYCKRPFIAYPLRQKGKPFELQLDLSKQALIDVKVYSDWKQIITPFINSGYIKLNNAFIRPTRYIDGLLLQGMDFNANGEHNGHGLTIEQIGMYSDSCWSLRRSNRILQYLKYDCVLNKIASPFGGMHTCDKSISFIGREDWRSNADKIQQFNTY